MSLSSPSKYLSCSSMSFDQRLSFLRSLTKRLLRTMKSPERLLFTKIFL